MRKLLLMAVVWMISGGAATATPPDLVCSGGGVMSRVRFEFPLITNYSDWYSSGVIPLSTYHTSFEYGPPDNRVSLDFYSEHIIGQWLLDGRADLCLYFEDDADEEGNITSYDLIIRTRSSGVVSQESGQFIYRGTYEFRVFDGSLSQGAPAVVFEARGKAQCT